VHAANWGFAAAFLATSVLSVVALVVVSRLVRSPQGQGQAGEPAGSGDVPQPGAAGGRGDDSVPVADDPIEPGGRE
jgi:hypothetical protein